MKRTPSEQAEFFEKIKAVSQRVRQQIPVAANRVEEFECPARSENLNDIHIQFYLYHEIEAMFRRHLNVIKEINKLMRDYFAETELGARELSSMEQVLFETHMHSVVKEMALKINEGQKALAIRFAPPEATAENLLAIFYDYLPQLQQGQELIIDEFRLISQFFASLRENIQRIKNDILKNKPLTTEELAIVSRYRREDLPHSDGVHRFYESLCYRSAIPQASIMLDQASLNFFMADAEHNISEAERKVIRIVQHLSFKERNFLSEQLGSKRDDCDQYMITEGLFNPSMYEGLFKKDLSTDKAVLHYLMRGSYWQREAIKTGLCDENACLSLVFLYEDGVIDYSDIVEKVSISYEEEAGDGHTFIVINRNPDSILTEIKTWGDDAILLDPWNDLVCYAKDYDQLPKNYLSYPPEANWRVITFPKNAPWMLYHLKSDRLDDYLSAVKDPAVKEARILEEFQIRSFHPEKEQALKAYIEAIVERYPQFKLDSERIQFKWIHNNTILIQIIPGFRKPVVALDDRLITFIANQSISSLMLDFGLLAELLKFNALGYTAKTFLPLPDQVFDIDKDALQAVGNYDAAEAFLRLQHANASKRHYGSADFLFMETMHRQVDYAAQLISPMVRLKMLDAARVGKKLDYIEKSAPPIPGAVMQEAKAAVPPIAIASSKQEDVIPGTASAASKKPSKRPSIRLLHKKRRQNRHRNRHRNKYKSPCQPIDFLHHNDAAPVFTIDTPADVVTLPLQSREQLFESLMADLPTLGHTLVPYEKTSAPYRKLYDFCQRIRDLKLNFDNPEDSQFADQLINLADQLRLKGFDYLYFTVSAAWGSHIDAYVRIYFVKDQLRESLDEQTYYFVQSSGGGLWKIYRTDEHCNITEIPINKVEDIQMCLEGFDINDQYGKPSEKIRFAIKKYNLARPLGFFKEMQGLINAFTRSSSLESALSAAEKIRSFMKKHEAHFSDVSRKTRYDHYFKAQRDLLEEDKLPDTLEPFYGTNLAKRIQWMSFQGRDLGNNKPWERFYAWASQDASGLIAEIMLRLGVATDEVILSLNDTFKAPLSSEEEGGGIYHGFVFLSYLPMPLMPYERYLTEELNSLVAATKLKKKSLDRNMLEDALMEPEAAYQRYFDLNKQHLSRYVSRETNTAQTLLVDYFFKLAERNEPRDIALIRSVFLGRDDGRDLKTLHLKDDEIKGIEKTPSELFMDSPFAEFIYSKNKERQTLANRIFTREDMLIFADKESRACHFSHKFRDENGSWRSADWSEVKQIFRAQDQNDELAFIELIEFCKNKNIELLDDILLPYFKQFPELSCFSKSVNALFDLALGNYLIYSFREMVLHLTWPSFDLDVVKQFSLEHLICRYRWFDSSMTFPSKEIQLHFGALIYELLAQVEDVADRIRFCEQWLTEKNPLLNQLSDNNLKKKVIKLLIESYYLQLGKDDDTPAYSRKAKAVVNKIIDYAYSVDRDAILDGLLQQIEAQETLSSYAGRMLEPEKYYIGGGSISAASSSALTTLFAVTNLFQDKPDNQAALLDYLSSPLTAESLSIFIDLIHEHNDADKIIEAMGYEWIGSELKEKGKERKDQLLSIAIESMYHKFWQLDLPKRSIITEAILIPAEQRINAEQTRSAYRWGFDFILSKLFSKAGDIHSDDYLAFCVLEAYLQSSKPHERPYLLAAALMASNQCAGINEVASVGKKLVSICEHMGPAYIKLAQAIHSHPQTPQSIKQDFSHIKGNANPPRHWELWRQININLSQEHQFRIKRLVKLLGSASYNLAVLVITPTNEYEVLLLLREGAEIDSQNGFEHIENTITRCKHPSIRSNTKTAVGIVAETRRMSFNEMSSVISMQQYSIAEKLYKRKLNIQAGSQLVEVDVVPSTIIAVGKRYRFIQRVVGVEFNDLPLETVEDNLIKTAVAKAVVYMELHNILQGSFFDSDRHGNQLKVDVLARNPLKLRLGLFDFGEMAVEAPNQTERLQLNHLLVRFVKSQQETHTLDLCLTEAISVAVAAGESSQYLMRIRKSLLALNDFLAYLTPQDIKRLLWDVLLRESDLHPDFYWSLKLIQVALTVDAAAEQMVKAKKQFLGFFSAPDAGKGVQHGYNLTPDKRQ